MVNVGLRVPVDAKKRLLDESKATGISEGTLARNYVLLGMQLAEQRQAHFSPVISELIEVLRRCPPAIQLQALDIVRVIAGAPLAPLDADFPSEDTPIEILARIGDG